jgi:hypothetical protein
MNEVNKYSEMLDLIADDLGIREMPSDYQKVRIATLINKSVGYLSVAEIGLAFDDYILGRTEVTPHYGKFSAQFVMSVIQAYNKKRGAKMLENKAKEMKSLPLSADQKQEIKKEFLAKLVDSFNKYRETGQISWVWLNWPVYNHFKEKGIIDAQLTEGDELRAKQDVLQNMTNRKYCNLDENLVESVTKGKSHERAILEFYDTIIENNEQIEKYI